MTWKKTPQTSSEEERNHWLSTPAMGRATMTGFAWIRRVWANLWWLAQAGRLLAQRGWSPLGGCEICTVGVSTPPFHSLEGLVCLLICSCAACLFGFGKALLVSVSDFAALPWCGCFSSLGCTLGWLVRAQSRGSVWGFLEAAVRLIKKMACLIGHGFPFSAALLGCCRVLWKMTPCCEEGLFWS